MMIDSTAMINSICCHSIASPNMPYTSMRMAIANAANFGAEPSSNVTAVGAP